jgi:hypothetical protein
LVGELPVGFDEVGAQVAAAAGRGFEAAADGERQQRLVVAGEVAVAAVERAVGMLLALEPVDPARDGRA